MGREPEAKGGGEQCSSMRMQQLEEAHAAQQEVQRKGGASRGASGGPCGRRGHSSCLEGVRQACHPPRRLAMRQRKRSGRGGTEEECVTTAMAAGVAVLEAEGERQHVTLAASPLCCRRLARRNFAGERPRRRSA